MICDFCFLDVKKSYNYTIFNICERCCDKYVDDIDSDSDDSIESVEIIT